MSKDKEPGQGRIYCCQICGDTWTMMPGVSVGAVGVSAIETCPCCIYIELARRHAHARNSSLRSAIGRYLHGQKKKGMNLEHVWRSKS